MMALDLLEQALKKLEDDLAWRTPNGHAMVNIVLPRALAEALLAGFKRARLMENPAPGGVQ